MVIFLALTAVALGIVNVNTPASSFATALSTSRGLAKVNVRENSPTDLSEIQYLGRGFPTAVLLLVSVRLFDSFIWLFSSLLGSGASSAGPSSYLLSRFPLIVTVFPSEPNSMFISDF